MPSKKLKWSTQLPTLEEVRRAGRDPLVLIVAEQDWKGNQETRHLYVKLVQTVCFTDLHGRPYNPTEGALARLQSPPSSTAWIGARFLDAPADRPYGPPSSPGSTRVFLRRDAVEVEGQPPCPLVDGRAAVTLGAGASLRVWYDAQEEVWTVKVVTPRATRVQAVHGTPPWTLTVPEGQSD